MSRVVVLAALAVASDAFMPALVPGLAPPLLAVMLALLSLRREYASDQSSPDTVDFFRPRRTKAAGTAAISTVDAHRTRAKDPHRSTISSKCTRGRCGAGGCRGGRQRLGSCRQSGIRWLRVILRQTQPPLYLCIFVCDLILHASRPWPPC